MKPASKPTARIDSQNQRWFEALQKYLTQNGVKITISPTDKTLVTYHLIIGSRKYVENITASLTDSSVRRIAIVLNPKNISDTSPFHIKTVITDTKTPSSREVAEIFAYFFTSSSPLLDLRILSTSKSSSRKLQHQSQATREPMLDDVKRIERIIRDVYTPPASSTHKVNKPKAILVACISVALLIIGGYIASISLGAILLSRSVSNLADGNIEQARRQAQASANVIRSGDQLLQITAPVFFLPGGDDVKRGLERFQSLLLLATDTTIHITGVTDSGFDFFTRVTSSLVGHSQDSITTSQLTTIKDDLTYTTNLLAVFEADAQTFLKHYPLLSSLLFSSTEQSEALKKIAEARKALVFFDQLTQLYPLVGGFRSEQTFLVLLQNSMELRPGGGFIGSVASAKTEDGSLRSFEIYDVYALDGQLKGHVDPPPEITTFLNQPHWYLRDSNWNPDFRKSATQAAWFYEKETGVAVDGVIGISLPLIQDLLRVTGPIDLPDFSDTVTADSFFGKALHYIHDNFFPGSTQKSNFLGLVSNKLIDTLINSKDTNKASVISTFIRGLEEKNIQLFMADGRAQEIIAKNGWAGAVPSFDLCSQTILPSCANDYLLLSEANFSLNKVNFFVHRNIVHTIQVHEKGGSTHKVSTTYTNKADDVALRGGMYSNLLRIYIPQNTMLLSLMADEEEVATDSASATSSAQLVSLAEQQPLREISLFSHTPAGEEKNISITYDSPFPKAPSPNSYYRLLHQKQPGIINTTAKTIVTFPEAWSLETELNQESQEESGGFLAKPGYFEYNTDLSKDTFLKLSFRTQ